MTHRRRTQPPDGSPPATGPTLDAASVEAVARRVVELIRSEGDSPGGRRLVDAATLAAQLGVERSWVYTHRAELGAIQLGSGSKPRLRFDVEVARRSRQWLLAARRVAVIGAWAAGPSYCPYGE
jgi:hypothetical protein